MFNKKKFITNTSLFCLITFATSLFTPNIVLANVSKELPILELPQQEPLETPTLQKNKEGLLDKLKEKGYGKKNKGPLKMPEAKTPEGTGKKADDKFKKEMGDMWKEKKLDKTDDTPDDSFFKKFLNDFNDENDKELKDKRSKDNINKFDKKLDTSNLYDLNKIKSQTVVPSSVSTPNCKKPSGWGSEPKDVPSGLKPLPNPKKKGHLIFPPIFFKRKKDKDNDDKNGKGKPVRQKAPSRVKGTIPTFIPMPQKSRSKEKAPTPQPSVQPQTSWRTRVRNTWDKAKKPVAVAGATAAAAYIGYKVVKGIAGFCIGGPLGAAVGVLSP